MSLFFCLTLRKFCSSINFWVWVHKKKKNPKHIFLFSEELQTKAYFCQWTTNSFSPSFLSLVFKLLPLPTTKKICWRIDFWRYRYTVFMLIWKSGFLLPAQIPIREDFLHHPNFHSFALFRFSFCRPVCIPTVMLSSIWEAKGSLRSFLHITNNLSRLSSHRSDFPGSSVFILREFTTVSKLKCEDNWKCHCYETTK